MKPATAKKLGKILKGIKFCDVAGPKVIPGGMKRNLKSIEFEEIPVKAYTKADGTEVEAHTRNIEGSKKESQKPDKMEMYKADNDKNKDYEQMQNMQKEFKIPTKKSELLQDKRIESLHRCWDMLRYYPEAIGKYVEIPRLYHDMQKFHKDITKEEFHTLLRTAERNRILNFTYANSPDDVPEPELGFREGYQFIYYAMFMPEADKEMSNVQNEKNKKEDEKRKEIEKQQIRQEKEHRQENKNASGVSDNMNKVWQKLRYYPEAIGGFVSQADIYKELKKSHSELSENDLDKIITQEISEGNIIDSSTWDNETKKYQRYIKYKEKNKGVKMSEEYDNVFTFAEAVRQYKITGAYPLFFVAQEGGKCPQGYHAVKNAKGTTFCRKSRGKAKELKGAIGQARIRENKERLEKRRQVKGSVKMSEESYQDSVTIFFGEIYPNKESVPKDKVGVLIKRGKNQGKYFARTRRQARQVAGAMQQAAKPEAKPQSKAQLTKDIHARMSKAKPGTPEYDSLITELEKGHEHGAKPEAKPEQQSHAEARLEQLSDKFAKTKKGKAEAELVKRDLAERAKIDWDKPQEKPEAKPEVKPEASKPKGSEPAKPGFIKRAVEKIFGKKVTDTKPELTPEYIDAEMRKRGLEPLSKQEKQEIQALNDSLNRDKEGSKMIDKGLGLLIPIGPLISLAGLGVPGMLGIAGIFGGLAIGNLLGGAATNAGSKAFKKKREKEILGKDYKKRKDAEKLKDAVWQSKSFGKDAEVEKDKTKKGIWTDFAKEGKKTANKLRKKLNLSEAEYNALMFSEFGKTSLKDIMLEAINKDMDYREAKAYAEENISGEPEPLSQRDVVEILKAIKAKSGKSVKMSEVIKMQENILSRAKELKLSEGQIEALKKSIKPE